MAISRKAAVGFIFVTLVIDVTGWGLIIPVLPKLLEGMVHGGVGKASEVSDWVTLA